MRLPRAVSEPLDFIRAEIAKSGVTLTLHDAPDLSEIGSQSGAYFAPSRKEIHAATKRPMPVWTSNLVHEYGHFQQWRRKSSLYQGLTVESIWCPRMTSQWCEGWIELTEAQKRLYFGRVAHVEWDAERRTLEFLRQWPQLGVDLEFYAVWANEYVLSYTAAADTRQWLQPNAITKYRKRMMELFPHKQMPWRWFVAGQRATDAYNFLVAKCMRPLPSNAAHYLSEA